MAMDSKYGHVSLEKGTVGEDEPVVVFRAQDRLLPKVLAYYRLFCWKEGSPQRHLEKIDEAMASVTGWQESHSTKVPSSDPPAAG